MANETRELGAGKPGTSKFLEYLYANLLFWAFLAVVAAISFFICGGVWDSVISGTLQYLFFILGGGFTLVSVLDWVYEKYNTGDGQNE